MKVELIHSTPLINVVTAIRRCYESDHLSDNLGDKDKALIHRIIESGHTSTIEHAVYTFDISGISRACLQELARHRVASLSVKSSRYTLGRIKSEESFSLSTVGAVKAKKYLVFTGNDQVDKASIFALERVRIGAINNVPNDVLKYAMPESMKTSLIWTINARSLRNFLELRSSNRALPEIRELSGEIYSLIPEDHKILFEGLTNVS